MASKRQYLTIAELEEYADITVTNNTEAYDQISQAEELIDSYVGFQCKSVQGNFYGRAESATSNTLTLESARHQNVFQNNYFTYCVVEIMDGTGSGQLRVITASTYAGVITVDAAWDTNPDSTSHYQIYQLAKFPRLEEDTYFDGIHSPFKYVKNIPEMVKRAVAAQVQFTIEMGTDYFAGNASNMESERIGNYSYSRGQNSDTAPLIAPKAKIYLRGIVNRKGQMTVSS